MTENISKTFDSLFKILEEQAKRVAELEARTEALSAKLEARKSGTEVASG